MPRNSARLATALVIASLTAVACNSGAAQPSSGSQASSTAAATSLSTAPPSAASPDAMAKILGSTPVPDNPGGLLSAFGSIWVAVRHGDRVARIDPSSGAITAQIKAAGEPAYLASDGQAVWVIEFSSQALLRIDPATNSTTTVPIPGDAGGWPVAGAGAIYQWTTGGLIEVDAASRRIVATNSTLQAESLALANGLVWVGHGTAGIDRLDRSTLALKDTVAPQVDASGVLAFDGTWMWAANRSTVTQLDAVTGTVLQTYNMPSNVDGGMASASAGRFWFQCPHPDAFGFIDGATRTLHPLQDLPSPVTEGLFMLAVDAHHLWISDWDANTVYRVDPGA